MKMTKPYAFGLILAGFYATLQAATYIILITGHAAVSVGFLSFAQVFQTILRPLDSLNAPLFNPLYLTLGDYSAVLYLIVLSVELFIIGFLIGEVVEQISKSSIPPPAVAGRWALSVRTQGWIILGVTIAVIAVNYLIEGYLVSSDAGFGALGIVILMFLADAAIGVIFCVWFIIALIRKSPLLVYLLFPVLIFLGLILNQFTVFHG